MTENEKLEQKMVIAFFKKAKEQNQTLNYEEVKDATMKIAKGYLEKNPAKAKLVNIFPYTIDRIMASEFFVTLTGVINDASPFIESAQQVTQAGIETVNEAIANLLFPKLKELENAQRKLLELTEVHKEKMSQAKKLNEAYKALKATK